MRSRVNSSRLERWYGKELTENYVLAMKGWYGDPIPVAGGPSKIVVDENGYYGNFRLGEFFCLQDWMEDILNTVSRKLRRMGRQQLATVQMAGLAGFADLLEVFRTNCQTIPFSKTSTNNATGACQSLWAVANAPIAGSAGAAAPGGTVHVSTDTGAFPLVNPTASERMYIAGGRLYKTVVSVSQPVLLYDRLFSVAKTMNSNATEAVTGVPTRYQSTQTNADSSADNNFLFIECQTVLAATAHNWTVCTYTSSNGTTGQTLPSVPGNASCPVTRFDMPINTWFCPLATGDRGILTLTQMQCNALVATGAINFVIGHPLAWLPYENVYQTVLDGIIGGFQLTRVFNSACLALAEVMKTNSTHTHSGYVNVVTR